MISSRIWLTTSFGSLTIAVFQVETEKKRTTRIRTSRCNRQVKKGHNRWLEARNRQVVDLLEWSERPPVIRLGSKTELSLYMEPFLTHSGVFVRSTTFKLALIGLHHPQRQKKARIKNSDSRTHPREVSEVRCGSAQRCLQCQRHRLRRNPPETN